MTRDVSIAVAPEHIDDDAHLRQLLSRAIGQSIDKASGYQLLKKSIDARRKVLYRLRYRVFFDEELPLLTSEHYKQYQMVADRLPVEIIGAGPAGYFAALQLLKLGLKPVVYDRGKDVRARRRDLKAIQQDDIVNPDSNYCFGEGGAGTYSDGKLYTRSHKRGSVRDVLEILVEHGAKTEILSDAHPHIGSNKLPKIVSAIRQTIQDHGGEVHFDHKLIDLQEMDSGKIELTFENGKKISSEHCILATGHSARNIYEMLHQNGIRIEAKEFSIGVRMEHPQELIDEIQYSRARGDDLPPARYALSCQLKDRSAYSFCMCPGGLIVPTATAPGELVINGMSLSRRDSPYANSGLVTQVPLDPEDKALKEDPLVMLRYQQAIEKKMFDAGDGSQKAPAQRLTDFIDGRASRNLGETSYIPGMYSAPLHEMLPEVIARSLRKSLKYFGKKLRGFVTEEAHVLALESRTSSPIRIPRHDKNLMHPDIPGLFPCGEGAGYAGGIMSAALDGMRVARAVKTYSQRK